ncbi:tetratricopeptide repeat protein [Rossellomorea aquimaris]|uniref:tetratricopeptide repeat protein n=1 Tax=Rossellomorea aquimaris TaxID=189382 RepID=UPI0005C8E0C3|nr:tetratricopeptide repeat protein [Rossellomorea aquimaris]
MNKKIEEAIELRESGECQASIERWKRLIQGDPDNGFLHYQCAWTHDKMGLESEAVPYYENSIQLGLDDKDLQGAYLGLGSTYRTLGEYEKSKSVFEEGIRRFPENKAMSVFYAMTLYNLNKHSQAMELLLISICNTSCDADIQAYHKAILYYSNQLDKVWK